MKKKSSPAVAKRSNEISSLLPPKIDGWTHHLVNTTKRGGKVVSTELDRVMILQSGLGMSGSKWVGGGATTEDFFKPPERELTPRYPYLASPLSYLAFGASWILDSAQDALIWIPSVSSPNNLPEPIRFLFTNVGGSYVLLSFLILARSVDSNSPGSFGIRHGTASLRTFKASGSQIHTVDFQVLNLAGDLRVSLEGGTGLDRLEFRRVQYRFLGSGGA